MKLIDCVAMSAMTDVAVDMVTSVQYTYDHRGVKRKMTIFCDVVLETSIDYCYINIQHGLSYVILCGHKYNFTRIDIAFSQLDTKILLSKCFHFNALFSMERLYP